MADGRGSFVYKVTTNGVRSYFVQGLVDPVGAAVDASGTFFTTDRGNVVKVTPDGIVSTFASGLSAPAGLAFDRAGNLYVGDRGVSAIYKYAPDGLRTTFATGGTPISLASPPPPPSPAPTLGIAPAAGQLALFWPASAGNCVLEATTNLNLPNWTAVTNGAPLTGVILSNASPPLFFRLRQF